MKRFYFLLFISFLVVQAHAQETQDKPKLVVGIVIDQMRYDYLQKFWSRFEDGGFKRMINEGYNFKNNHYNYAPTFTGPGHTSVWTGTSPMNHGIIGNDWYSKFEDQMVYCAGDDHVDPVGTESAAGKMSPHRMVSTTLADQNRLHTQFRGKTIGVSIKDRGAILPAGHTANAAYWFVGGDEGKFVTSSYYMNELPQWAKDFNNSGKNKSYLKTWNTLYEIDSYIMSGPDKNNFEGGFKGNETAEFPYELGKISKDNGRYSIIPQTPYGDDITLDFAEAAILGEQLGQDADTDILALSFSSTDKVGHNFGVNSKELEDTYLRLDKNISDLLTFLDQNVGENNYTVFLTSDHAGNHVSGYLESVRIPTNNLEYGDFIDAMEVFLQEKYDTEGLISNVSNQQIFFNYKKLEEEEINTEDFEKVISAYLLQQPGIYKVFTRTELTSGSFDSGVGYVVQNGFNQKRSGDIAFVKYPGSGFEKGSMHGSVWNYDTHAPLLFFGKGIPHGSTFERTEIIDIAPTMAALLGIEYPNATSGKPLFQMLDLPVESE
ncbi:MAG: alkaline phosphatase PafA [Christiangramia sp.]|uniref:alkaline phosphatase PafA n=1 Tax=Christiangramia sp. TaxID=1931228 RepID=UPI003242ABE1